MIQGAALQFEANAEVLRGLIKALTQEQAQWKPSLHEWSILEVLNHLYDEEKEDFRKRLRSTLETPEKPWEPINPANWVNERHYNQQGLQSSLENFLDERQVSLQWLGTLANIDLNVAHTHPEFGAFSANDLLASWLAHDLLHIRQITRLKYQYIAKDFAVLYAGNW